jgi:hypothetical protein
LLRAFTQPKCSCEILAKPPLHTPHFSSPEKRKRGRREKEEPLKPLQFWVFPSVYDAFSIEAVKEGGGKGAKTALFLKVWERYRRDN